MKWVSIKDDKQTPPFSEQLLIAITEHQVYFGWLAKIEITVHGRELIFTTTVPDEHKDEKVKWWCKIDRPKDLD